MEKTEGSSNTMLLKYLNSEGKKGEERNGRREAISVLLILQQIILAKEEEADN